MKSSLPWERVAWAWCIGRRTRNWDARWRLIKVLPDAFGQDPVRVARFDREARAAAALNHPNICAIHEIGEHDGQPFIVMELMKGQTLEARLSSRSSRPASIRAR